MSSSNTRDFLENHHEQPFLSLQILFLRVRLSHGYLQIRQDVDMHLINGRLSGGLQTVALSLFL